MLFGASLRRGNDRQQEVWLLAGGEMQRGRRQKQRAAAYRSIQERGVLAAASFRRIMFWVIFGCGPAKSQGPVYPYERTSSGRPVTSERCQQQTHALQQKSGIASHRPRSRPTMFGRIGVMRARCAAMSRRMHVPEACQGVRDYLI